MAKHLGPLEVQCDAPSYRVVEICADLGLITPLDVRWCRLTHFLETQAESNRRGFLPWRWLFGRKRPTEKTCSCSESLPDLEPYTFTFFPEGIAEYRLGQCTRCHTIFWEPGDHS